MLCTLYVTCNLGVQYVGETSQMLRSRTIIGLVFTSTNHNFNDALIIPIEQIPETPISISHTYIDKLEKHSDIRNCV